MAVSAITRSRKLLGKLYESHLSSYHQVFVSPNCEVKTEMVTFTSEGLNMVMIAVVLAVITSIMLIFAIALCCRRKGRQYEIVSVLSPSKYLASAGLISSRGWRGDTASDIPASLFPKHVQVDPVSSHQNCHHSPNHLQGLHASGNLAFVKDFEAFQRSNNEFRGTEAGAVVAHVDTWEAASAFICVLSSSPLSDRSVWRTIWEAQVELLLTFISSSASDDLALFSSSKFIGSYQLQLESEREMGDFLVRTLKVRNRGTTRTVTQLVFLTWPDWDANQGPSKSSFLAFLRESSVIQNQSTRPGPVLVWSGGCGPDPAIFWMCLDTMARMIRSSGDTNLSHYTKYLATNHRLQLSSHHMYIQLHDMLAWAVQHNKLEHQHSVRYI